MKNRPVIYNLQDEGSITSGFLERDHVGVMRGILKNSGKEQTFYGESVAHEHTSNAGRRFFDLIDCREVLAGMYCSRHKNIWTESCTTQERARTASERAGGK